MNNVLREAWLGMLESVLLEEEPLPAPAIPNYLSLILRHAEDWESLMEDLWEE